MIECCGIETKMMGNPVIDLPDRQLQVLVRAHLDKYGKAAAANAQERANTLSEMGDDDGAKMWRRIAELLASVE